jgi:predicted Zn-dependent protease
MRSGIWLGITFACLPPGLANCQPPVPETVSFQERKVAELAEHLAYDIESRDGRIVDSKIVTYLSQIESRLASSAGRKFVDIRVTQSRMQYVALLPNRVLYISAGLLAYVQNEMELAGLIAHELAHANQAVALLARSPVVYGPQCVVTQGKAAPLGWLSTMREKEAGATATATSYMKAAGYDPSGVLDLLSKLAYEHPDWSQAIVPDDLLRVRAEIESGTTPAGGFIIDSSSFRQMQAALAAISGQAVRASGILSRPTLYPQ